MINYKKLRNLLIWKCKTKNVGSSQLPTATRMADLNDGAEKEPILFACGSCNRTFLPEALAKHSKVCEKILMKKRKTFDSSKQRLQGTELEAYATLAPVKTPKKKDDPVIRTKTSPSKWKEKQSDVVKTIQAAKKSLSTTPSAVVTAKPSDHQKCPFCERYFGPKAYGRHVDWCKGQQLKFKHTNINIEARERLQVRTGYRAPLPNKVLTRDKYQPGGPRSRDPSLTKADSAKSKVSEPISRSQTFNLSRTPVGGQAIESRINQTPNLNLTSPLTTKRKIKVENETISTPMKSVVLPLAKSNSLEKSDINKYDPFESAEQQMMELFSADSQRESTNGKNRKNDNSSTTIHNNNNDYKQSTVSPEQITPDLQKSSSTTPTKSPTPISAFALYTRKSTPTDNLSASVDDDNNKKINDNELAIDGDNNQANENRPSSPIAFINKPLDELEKELLLNNLESCSVVSIDSVVDSNKSAPLLSLAGGKYLRSNSDIVAPKLRKPTGDGVGKSNSAGSGRSSNKYKLNMQQMLFGDSPPPSHASNSNLSLTVDKPTSEDINAATVGLLEECEAELMLELEKMLTAQSSTTITPPSPQLPSIQSSFAICSSDDQPETMDKLSGDKRSVGNTTIDSAYSSLTRVLSEGGGGGGFSGGGGKDTFKLEQSRFCHECGTQYPVAVAKFCCYCGMRRIAI
ncbi:uncharacterized protein isoform X6 [Rhodnius prolixus]|uniref:uncharacterized protein isoform X6 n=2 Tax=Rhodnius prolixus TaxID=13249 RepID=UPI003D18A5D0